MFDQTNNFVRKLSGKLMVKTKFKIPNSSRMYRFCHTEQQKCLFSFREELVKKESEDFKSDSPTGISLGNVGISPTLLGNIRLALMFGATVIECAVGNRIAHATYARLYWDLCNWFWSSRSYWTFEATASAASVATSDSSVSPLAVTRRNRSRRLSRLSPRCHRWPWQ